MRDKYRRELRCEPPEHLKEIVGLHILIDPHGEPLAAALALFMEDPGK
jgi:hypothetical protein